MSSLRTPVFIAALLQRICRWRMALVTVLLAAALPGMIGTQPAHAQSSAYWLGEYFNNATLEGQPVLLRTTRNIWFNWGTGSPSRAIPANNFSARWTRTLFLQRGRYQLRLRADDGVRLYVDNRLVVDEWRDGPARDSSATVDLGGEHLFRVEFYERSEVASVRFTIVRAAAAQTTGTWRGEYFANPSLSGAPAVIRNDANINFDFQGGAPAAGLPADNFSVRWTRQLTFNPGNYTFLALVDDGVRLYVGNRLVIDQWVDGGQRELSSPSIFLSGAVPVRLEYYDRTGGAVARLQILNSPAVAAPTATPIPVISDWRAEYFNNPDLAGAPSLIQNELAPGGDGPFDVSTRARGSVGATNVSARWSRQQTFAPGTYRLRGLVDDGIRIFVNGQLLLNEWRDGAQRPFSVDVALNGPTDLRIEYYNRAGGAVLQIAIESVAAVGASWQGQYFNNAALSGSPALVRNDADVNFNFGASSPDPAKIPVDNFSVRWTRTFNLAPQNYRFQVFVDDGARVYVGNQLIIDAFVDGPPRTLVADAFASGTVEIRVEYLERGGSGQIQFRFDGVPASVPTPAP
jgi:hypothetical protein